MPQSLSAVYLHAVFSTKERWPYLRDPAFRAEVHSVLAGITNRLDCPPVEIGGMEDHVHVLARFGRTITLAEWIKEMKRPCTQWINDTGPGKCRFAWQAGYGIFSVSPSNVDAVQKYILEQEERHKKVTFQDEFRALLRKHGLEWDERYVWD